MITPEFWANAPKQFCDNSYVAITANPKGGENFLLALGSGQSLQVFAFSPAHMKRFAQLTSFHVKQFEEKFGPIQAVDWTPDIVSPIQIEDTGNNKDEDHKKEKK